MEGFYTTKLTFEVDVSTQFGPEDAKKIIESRLIGPATPAISNLRLISGWTNYSVPHKLPSENWYDLKIGRST